MARIRNAGEYRWQPTRLNSDDFQAGDAENTTITAGSQPKEVLYAVIREDNGVNSQLASYKIVRPGRAQSGGDTTSDESWYGVIKGDQDGDGTVEEVDPRTQLRLVSRPLNGDDRTPLTDWVTVRDLDRQDPRQRIPFPPSTTTNGNGRVIPQGVEEGDVLAIEARNPATDVVISRADSTLEFPAAVGY